MRQVGRQVSRYFIHQIVLERGAVGVDGTGTDVYGEPLAAGGGATPVALTLDARVEWDNQRMTDANGEEVVCAGYVCLAKEYTDPVTGLVVPLTVGAQDRIIFRGRRHAVAQRNRDEGWIIDRGEHYEVWIR